ncbi:MAG: DNA gyrase C-terminal beta-propeller domain-containing protein, partial [Oscillospiraceae bacterium]|nr:DNA gyrase C-terminal beta-propeller domain-containing protein [Oscillospiraceae bacterium]
GIRAAYATGRGRVVIRARHELEEFGNGRTRIVITEIPYQDNKRLEGSSDSRDESDRNGMRIVIELKKDANTQVVLNRLFAQTQLQTTFAINMLALVDDQSQPKILSLRHILDEYLKFQEEVLTRRTKYDLRKAKERAHLLEGLLVAQDNIDEVIRIIRSSYDNAKENLMSRFGLDDIQAQAILDMRLKALQGLDREKLEAEYKELEERIEYYNSLLADESLLKGVLKDELIAIRDKFGDDRVTEIQDVEDEIDIEDLIEEEQSVYTMTRAGYIKRMPASTYRSQRRGGRGITAQSLREEDCVETVFTASTHDFLLFFTDTGKVHRKKGYLIPEAGRSAKGTNIVNILPVEPGEKVTAMLHVKSLEDDSVLMMVTRKGTVKRLPLNVLNTARKAGIRAITLEEGDELIAVLPTSGEDNILLMTHDGMAICFKETDVRCMGRDAVGVRGIRLKEGDYVVSAAVAAENATLLTITENGYGKRTAIGEYLRGDEAQHRGGGGLKGYQVTEKTGKIAGAKVVDGSEDILLISDDGTIIRMAVEDVNCYGRTTQGVRVMRLSEGSRVISLAKADKEEDEETGDQETAPEGTETQAQPQE